MPTPLVIAHRGASGERPEHTRAAYELAIEQGADFIEPDLVMSKDGHLVVRHENEIGGTTNVADHPEFADRRTTKTIDGVATTGWFTEDFTFAELQTLRARERLPTIRPGNTAWPDETILTFQQVIDIAREATVRTGRVIGVAPELKHPTHFEQAGLSMIAPFVEIVRRNDLAAADSPIVVQCFEVGTLKTLNGLIDSPLAQLMSPSGGPADLPGQTYAAMVTPEGLAELAAYAEWAAVETAMVIPRTPAGAAGTPTMLVADAHLAGLKVVVWTFRAEDMFLPTDHRGDLPGWIRRFYDLGVDAVFSDFPGVAVAARP
ncbi:glycerophosphodiester phosphodiesterase [Brevundimonas sp. NIBR11]|uniref:glycerophosphodiester phosphodiesterase n=1 Tax=Brevundimonas sp. NIBR11 TaxID=3015999 RepID=UPI0022F0509B|nr:glycerophosphodiester phosphodiesterase [Brevundimonas sp. NIBR11]WGM30881.1 Glycerophosphodiester phosphodiesterase, periplasmic [Brevundimonas sp. NIBR11]